MKKIITLCLSLCMTAALAAPAYALEYSIAAPDDYDFGRDTSIEVIHTADGGATKNADMSKNAALIPPALLGARTYKVTDVFKVSETDRSGLADSGENMLTLYTCVRNQRDQRWCVTAVEV